MLIVVLVTSDITALNYTKTLRGLEGFELGLQWVEQKGGNPPLALLIFVEWIGNVLFIDLLCFTITVIT